jgi:hypothetical protein
MIFFLMINKKIFFYLLSCHPGKLPPRQSHLNYNVTVYYCDRYNPSLISHTNFISHNLSVQAKGLKMYISMVEIM